MELSARIYVAGHRGLAGSALVRRLASGGFRNLLTRTHAELELTDQAAVRKFFEQQKPAYHHDHNRGHDVGFDAHMHMHLFLLREILAGPGSIIGFGIHWSSPCTASEWSLAGSSRAPRLAISRIEPATTNSNGHHSIHACNMERCSLSGTMSSSPASNRSPVPISIADAIRSCLTDAALKVE